MRYENVDNNFHSRRRRSFSPRHDRDDRRPEGAGRLRAAHGPCESGCNADAWRFLGRYCHSSRAVLQRNHDDDHRLGERWPPDISARARACFWGKCRHHRHRLARCTYRRPRVADRSRTTDDFRRGFGQVIGPRTLVRLRRGARWIWAGAVWADNASARDGRAGRNAGRPKNRRQICGVQPPGGSRACSGFSLWWSSALQ